MKAEPTVPPGYYGGGQHNALALAGAPQPPPAQFVKLATEDVARLESVLSFLTEVRNSDRWHHQLTLCGRC